MMSGGKDRKLWIGIGISLFFLLLLFRKMDFRKLYSALLEMDYRYIVVAVILTFASYFFRAVRWRYLLTPMKKISLSGLYSATIIGYMANNILPARLGEFVRAYVLGESEQLDKTPVFATLVIDRLFDGFTILIVLLITFFSIQLPPGMEKVQHALVVGGYITLAIYIGAILFLTFLKRKTVSTLRLVGVALKPFPASVSERIIPLLGSFIQGLRLSSDRKERLLLIVSSVIIWAFAIYSLDMVLRAYGISLPVTGAMFIMVFLVFAVMVPASPGYIGTYHAACVYGLMAFNVPIEKAMSVAIMAHAVNFFPVILAGFYYLWRNKVSLADVTRKSAQQGAMSE